MIVLDLAAIPNQSISIRLSNSLYDIRVKALNDGACIDISRDSEVVFSGMRITPGSFILPYAYLEKGNFMLSSLNDELPDYLKFGVSQMLYYFTPAELEALSAGT